MTYGIWYTGDSYMADKKGNMYKCKKNWVHA